MINGTSTLKSKPRLRCPKYFYSIRPLLSSTDLKLKTSWRLTECYMPSTLVRRRSAGTQHLKREQSRLFILVLLEIYKVEKITNSEVLRRMNRSQEIFSSIEKMKSFT